MSPNDKEQAQLRRLRESNARQPVTLIGMWRETPLSWKGFFYGVSLGTITLFVLPMFWISRWAVPSSAISIIVFGLFGVVLGRALDARENIKNLMK